MDNLEMTFPSGIFYLISSRHTVINAKQIYNYLTKRGVLVIEGVDQIYKIDKFNNKLKNKFIRRKKSE